LYLFRLPLRSTGLPPKNSTATPRFMEKHKR
jgi:hypothetical protein